MGIETVAVASTVDSAEPHAREADTLVILPGSAASETYLDAAAVLAAAAESGADAVHPGYGFLSENSGFAKAVNAAGLTWIGPSPESIAVMGSKLESKELVKRLGLPTLPSADVTGLSPEEISSLAADIGYPVLVKADAGGGGKGMRIVQSSDDLSPAVEGAGREAKSAFGDGTVFLEKYLESPRHIEIQIARDARGNTVSLFERECSIQRRHQKIIEETPSVAISDDIRMTMGDASKQIADEVDYSGVGTVEFLFQDDEFFFLEMNTRLQVEHPVTEMVTGLDLVELQIAIANGNALSEVARNPTRSGHSIEARLYAEDPAQDFLPVTGTIDQFHFAAQPGLRVDSSVESGSVISVFYDPMIAKVITHAPTRGEAISILAGALRAARIHGSRTNRSLLVRILEHPDFASGRTDTGFISRNDLQALASPLGTAEDELMAARAAALADQVADRKTARVLASLPSGWRNLPAIPQLRTYRGILGEYPVSYSITGDQVGFGDVTAKLGTVTSTHVEFEIDGSAMTFDIGRANTTRYVDTEQVPVTLEVVSRFPIGSNNESAGSLHSPMPGKIVRVEVEVGDRVETGQLLMVLEAMKMEHSIYSPYDGTVSEVAYSAGEQVESDAVVVVVAAHDEND